MADPLHSLALTVEHHDDQYWWLLLELNAEDDSFGTLVESAVAFPTYADALRAGCAALVLDPSVVLVDGRPVKPFQGWRYLDRDEAPRDILEAEGSEPALPPALRLALVELCLL